MQRGPCQCCSSCQSGSLLACNDEAAGSYQDMARVAAGHYQLQHRCGKLRWKLVSGGLKGDPTSHNMALALFDKLGRWRMVLHTFDESQADVASYSMVMRNAGLEDSWQLAIALLDKILDAKLRLDTTAMNTAIACIPRWEFATEVLLSMSARSMPKDIITVNAAVNACEKSLKWSCASSLLMNAGCSQLQASEWSFNTFASALFKSKQWRAALDLGDATVTRGVLAFSYSNSWSFALAATESLNIDDIAWSAIVSACEKTVQWEMALTSLARMSQTRLQGSIVVCNAATSACESGQQWRHAFRTLTSSHAAQVQVDLISWNAVCSAAEKCSKWHKVFALVSQLRLAALPGPDAFSYGAAFFAAAETAWTVALQLQGAMQMQALQLDVIMQGSLLQALMAHRSAKVEDSFDRLSALAISLCGMLKKTAPDAAAESARV